jgi:hypothetical protein
MTIWRGALAMTAFGPKAKEQTQGEPFEFDGSILSWPYYLVRFSARRRHRARNTRFETGWIKRYRGAAHHARCGLSMRGYHMIVLIYVDTSKQIGDKDHLKVSRTRMRPRRGFKRTTLKAWRLNMR